MVGHDALAFYDDTVITENGKGRVVLILNC